MNENYLVTKANTLITSNYDLSLEEQRIILTLASTVQPTDEDFKPYNFSIKDFTELLGVEDKRKYSKIPKITKDLMQKVLEIKLGDDVIQVAWLSSAHYRKGSGTVELEFSPKLKPFMLGLKEFYTSYRLKNVLELKGKYSIRMYEILKSNEFKKVAEIEVNELRKILKADTGSYLIYQNFRNRIILQAQKELNEKTDISFDFEEVKTGRKVTALRFYIKATTGNQKDKLLEKISNKHYEQVDIEKGIQEVVRIMDKHDVQPSEAMRIWSSANGEVQLITKVYKYFKDKEANNFIGLMVDMVKPGVFHEPIKNVNNDKFNNFQQRTYDLDKLERKLLGWNNEMDKDK